ncbi:MAG: cytochrome c [Reinekea sp.]|jgi:cytochrome c553
MNKLAISMLVGTILCGSAWAADIEAGKAKAVTCAACHNTNGISSIPMYPNLAGQKEEYIYNSLKAFKSKERTGNNAAIMWGLAAPLSDDDMKNLAAYFSSLDPSGK